VRFQLLPGQRYDTVGVAPWIEGIQFDGLITDKTFDSNWTIDNLLACEAQIVVSQRPNRLQPQAIDPAIYTWRHLIENFFCRLKQFRRIAMCSDKTDTSYAAMINLVATLMALR